MADQTIKTIIQQRHDTEANWNTSVYKPLAGEIIIYDVDNTHTYERLKIGDGVNYPKDLPFAAPDEIYVGNGDMPDEATIQIVMDGSDEEEALQDDLKEYIDYEIATEIVDLPNNELLVHNVAQKVPYVKVAEQPTFVNSIEEMTDISKMYVLKSDGMFYSYKAHTTTTPGGTVANFINKMPTSIDANGNGYNDKRGYKDATRLSSSGSEKGDNFYTAFGYIPVSGGDTIRFTGQEHNGADVLWYDTTSQANYICVYDKDFKFLYAGLPNGGYNTDSFVESMSVDGVVSVIKLKDVANIAYFRMSVQSGYSASGITGESAIITVNEEITYTTREEGTTTTYSWESTGISYNQPADYEHRVIAMENELEVLLNGTF